MTGSCTAAAGMGATAVTAATTRLGPTVSTASRTTTAGSSRPPASPATATLQVRGAAPSWGPVQNPCPSQGSAGRDRFGRSSLTRGLPISPLCLSPAGVEPGLNRGWPGSPQAPCSPSATARGPASAKQMSRAGSVSAARTATTASAKAAAGEEEPGPRQEQRDGTGAHLAPLSRPLQTLRLQPHGQCGHL